MAFFHYAILIALVAALSPVLFSYITRGWVAKYDSPPYSTSDIPDLTGKIALVTGTNTGIGYITARELARKGARVIATARSVSKGRAAVAQMKQDLGAPDATIEFMELDLASLQSVKNFAQAYTEKNITIDMLILNAGVMMSPFSKTADGFELQVCRFINVVLLL